MKRVSTTDDMEIDNETIVKKVKKNETKAGLSVMIAGLSEQPCADK